MAQVTKYSDVFYGSQNVRSRWKWVYEIIETPDTYKVDLVATLESYVYGSNIGKTDTINAYLKATDKAQEAWEKNGVARNYSINKGNTWGGTDIFSSTIEWAKTHSAQSKAIRTNATGSYIAATIYTPEFTIPIKTTYLINYDANGGTGAPAQQTKWHGENITLQSGIPTRAGYTFLGWATSQGGAVAYQPSATYTANSPLTLYAVWEAYYTYTINTTRVNASGDIIEDPNGEYIYIKANLTTEDYTNNPLTAYHFKDNGATATVGWYKNSDKTDSVTFPYQPTANSFILYAWYHADTEKHEVSFQFDTTHTTGKVISVIVPPIFRTMDFLAGGQGVAFGMPATQNGMFINMDLAIKEYSGNIKNIYEVFYPVGSYYETSDSTFDPNTAWGGTWVLESGGRVHVSAGTMENNSTTYWGSDITDWGGHVCNFPIGESGGETKHTLDATQMPSHYHNTQAAFSIRAMDYNGGQPVWGGNGTTVSKITGSKPDTITQKSAQSNPYNVQINKNSDSKGGGEAHNNMQPYIVVNRWHRTA